MAAPLLSVENLTMRFGGLVAVDALSLTAYQGEITALIGPNGAGKTTVFNCITGFYKPTEGRIIMHHGGHLEDDGLTLERLTQTGQRSKDGLFLLERMPDFEVSKLARVARTFQNIRLFTGMTVLENLLVAQHNVLMKHSFWSLKALLNVKSYQRAEKQAMDKAVHWLEQIGLTNRADDPAGSLPYGDQRRLEIARALCTDPLLLCLDEPAAGLNPHESFHLSQLLRSIKQDGISILLIEHDMSVVMDISDHVIVLEYGVKIADGTAADIRTNPKVIAAYLGVEDEEIKHVQAEVGL
jgi:branched-chain amino acid transport system ATP-binding protein